MAPEGGHILVAAVGAELRHLFQVESCQHGVEHHEGARLVDVVVVSAAYAVGFLLVAVHQLPQARIGYAERVVVFKALGIGVELVGGCRPGQFHLTAFLHHAGGQVGHHGDVLPYHLHHGRFRGVVVGVLVVAPFHRGGHGYLTVKIGRDGVFEVGVEQGGGGHVEGGGGHHAVVHGQPDQCLMGIVVALVRQFDLEGGLGAHVHARGSVEAYGQVVVGHIADVDVVDDGRYRRVVRHAAELHRDVAVVGAVRRQVYGGLLPSLVAAHQTEGLHGVGLGDGVLAHEHFDLGIGARHGPVVERQFGALAVHQRNLARGDGAHFAGIAGNEGDAAHVLILRHRLEHLEGVGRCGGPHLIGGHALGEALVEGQLIRSAHQHDAQALVALAHTVLCGHIQAGGILLSVGGQAGEAKLAFGESLLEQVVLYAVDIVGQFGGVYVAAVASGGGSVPRHEGVAAQVVGDGNVAGCCRHVDAHHDRGAVLQALAPLVVGHDGVAHVAGLHALVGEGKLLSRLYLLVEGSHQERAVAVYFHFGERCERLSAHVGGGSHKGTAHLHAAHRVGCEHDIVHSGGCVNGRALGHLDARYGDAEEVLRGGTDVVDAEAVYTVVADLDEALHSLPAVNVSGLHGHGVAGHFQVGAEACLHGSHAVAAGRHIEGEVVGMVALQLHRRQHEPVVTGCVAAPVGLVVGSLS